MRKTLNSFFKKCPQITSSILKYKDFIATVKYSDEDKAFIGRIEGISSVFNS